MAQLPNGTGPGIRSRAAHRHGLQCGSPRLAAEESLVPWKTWRKHGENVGKLGKIGRQCGKHMGKIVKIAKKNLRNLWESLCGNYMETYMGTICGIIWEKTGENSKNIRDNLGKLRENVGQK